MWEVYSIKYAERGGRTRADSFLLSDRPNEPHNIDYFVWVLRKDDEVILVDTGYDSDEANRRDRPVRRSPEIALAPLGIKPEMVTTIICTHLHYDHAGGLHLFPNATAHLQVAEMVYATGPCMCHGLLREPFTKQHISTVIDRLYSDKLVFHEGEGVISEGVSVHRVGGHSRGLQVVRVYTESGWMVLASDASHFYENFLEKKVFPIVVDVEDALRSFSTIQSLASETRLVVPGHDPLVATYFPSHKVEFIQRLDKGPNDKCLIT